MGWLDIRICTACGKEACGAPDWGAREDRCGDCDKERFRKEHDLFWGGALGKFLLAYVLLGWAIGGLFCKGHPHLAFGYLAFWFFAVMYIFYANEVSAKRFSSGY